MFLAGMPLLLVVKERKRSLQLLLQHLEVCLRCPLIVSKCFMLLYYFSAGNTSQLIILQCSDMFFRAQKGISCLKLILTDHIWLKKHTNISSKNLHGTIFCFTVKETKSSVLSLGGWGGEQQQATQNPIKSQRTIPKLILFIWLALYHNLGLADANFGIL